MAAPLPALVCNLLKCGLRKEAMRFCLSLVKKPNLQVVSVPAGSAEPPLFIQAKLFFELPDLAGELSVFL